MYYYPLYPPFVATLTTSSAWQGHYKDFAFSLPLSLAFLSSSVSHLQSVSKI